MIDYSLQRKQPDSKIPLVERAAVVNYLVPGGESLGRDIGIEFRIADYKYGSFSLGFFNGNGVNNISYKKNFLFVNRGSFLLINNSASKIVFGYSLAYRNAHNITFSKIFGNNEAFTGKDFRFGFDEQFGIGNFELQSEYLQANIGGKKAGGYYALLSCILSAKHLLSFSVEQFNDLNPATPNEPWYIAGYTYKLKGDEIKFSLDNEFQFLSNKTNSVTILQLQYFFK